MDIDEKTIVDDINLKYGTKYKSVKNIAINTDMNGISTNEINNNIFVDKILSIRIKKLPNFKPDTKNKIIYIRYLDGKDVKMVSKKIIDDNVKIDDFTFKHFIGKNRCKKIFSVIYSYENENNEKKDEEINVSCDIMIIDFE